MRLGHLRNDQVVIHVMTIHMLQLLRVLVIYIMTGGNSCNDHTPSTVTMVIGHLHNYQMVIPVLTVHLQA